MTAYTNPVDGGLGDGRGWRRAAVLVGVTFATSMIQPSVLVAVPFLVVAGFGGLRGGRMMIASLVAMVLVVSGVRDGLWYASRAWAVLAGGGFVAITMLQPRWHLGSRVLGAVFGAMGAAALILGVRQGSFATLDFAVANAAQDGVARALDALQLVRGGEAVSPALVSALYETAGAQAKVFPAMLGIASMAGLAVAWWLYQRLSGGRSDAIGPLKEYRFNDHLVWLLIGGMLLLLSRWGESVSRVGANAVVFMGALYTLRGAAVFMFVSGGLSLFGYVLLAIGVALAAPVVIGLAMMVGIGDTWLDVRTRVREMTA